MVTKSNPQQWYGFHTVHEALSSPDEFGPQHIEQFRELGFVAIENVFTREEIEIGKQAMRDLIAQGDPNIVAYEPGTDVAALSPDERLGYARRLFRFTAHEPRLKKMMEHPRLRSIAEQLAGAELELIQDMALMKAAHVGSEKPWHQDTAYFLVEPPEKVIGTWTALDNATPENGCMHLVPGSHLEGPQPHCHDRDCMLPDEEERVANDVMVPLAPGGVLFFSGLVHHGTPPNASSDHRWALQFHYAAQGYRSIPHEAHGEYFRDGLGAAGCANWATDVPRRTMPEN